MTTSNTEHRSAHPRRRVIMLVALAAVVATAGVVAYVADRNSSETTDHGGGWIGPVEGDEGVVYEFHDASVAPDYHRSYTLTVWKGSARLVVDSYGDVIHDMTKRIDDALWQRTLTLATEFADADSVTNDGCSGGTSEELTVFVGDEDGDEDLVHVFIDHCDTSGGANIMEAVGEVLPLFDLDTLLATG